MFDIKILKMQDKMFNDSQILLLNNMFLNNNHISQMNSFEELYNLDEDKTNFYKILRLLISHPDYMHIFEYIKPHNQQIYYNETYHLLNSIIKFIFDDKEKHYKIFEIFYNCIGYKKLILSEINKYIMNVIYYRKYKKLELVLYPRVKEIDDIVFKKSVDIMYLMQFYKDTNNNKSHDMLYDYYGKYYSTN